MVDALALTTLKTTMHGSVLEVALNRPKRLNAMNTAFWKELKAVFEAADHDHAVRCVVLTGGECRLFSAGLDLMSELQSKSEASEESLGVGRRGLRMLSSIEMCQTAVTAVEQCKKPVVAAMHSGVIGGAVDLVCACDIRYATRDTYFKIAEVNVGLAADVGTLQRLPKIVGNDSIVRELAYTGRKMSSEEAVSLGLLGRLLETKQECWDAAHATAQLIAKNSPVAVVGTKVSLNYSRDHTTQDGLRQIAHWNMSMLQSEDLVKAAGAFMMKKEAKFSKL